MSLLRQRYGREFVPHERPQRFQPLDHDLLLLHVPNPHIPPKHLPTPKTRAPRREQHALLRQQPLAKRHVVHGPPGAHELHKRRRPRDGSRPAHRVAVLGHERRQQRQVRPRQRDVARQQVRHDGRAQRERRHRVVQLRHADGGVVARGGARGDEGGRRRRDPAQADAREREGLGHGAGDLKVVRHVSVAFVPFFSDMEIGITDEGVRVGVVEEGGRVVLGRVEERAVDLVAVDGDGLGTREGDDGGEGVVGEDGAGGVLGVADGVWALVLQEAWWTERRLRT